jgi:hypothetical protein
MGLSQSLSSIRGVVSDESGAVIPGVKIMVTGPGGIAKATISGADGSYNVNGLAPGKYAVAASAQGLTQAQPAMVDLGSAAITLNIQLQVAAEKQVVNVQSDVGPTVSTDPANNAGALILRGEDLQALSDDPDDLQSDLQALAGPAAGPNGGQIYIDGFTGGQLPNKDSIREIRINQNPFSPEYDKIGFGRIEILTKPGTDKFRGQAYFNYGDSIFNSRNPYAAQKAPFDLKEFGGNLSGPINKKASFFLDVDDRIINNSAIIDAFMVDTTTLGVNPFTQVLVTPFRRLRISPRVDYQLNANNTLTVRYGYTRNSQDNAGVGGFTLPSAGYNSLSTDQTLQVVETAVLSAKVINETRFQLFHTNSLQNTLNDGASISVLSAFNGGGSQFGRTVDDENHYELQNYTSVAGGVHSWKFGVRIRAVTLTNTSPQNFGGSFSFAGGYVPVLDANNEPVDPGIVCNPAVQVAGCVDLTSIQRYQRTLMLEQAGYTPAQVAALGGGATQFSINVGNPLVALNQVDAGLFVGDDWRVRPNLTLSLGLRWETQTNIHDHSDWAPRVGFAWAPGQLAKGASRPKTVFRGGFGIFYDRFSEQNIETADRFNGVTQQQYVVTNPNFFPNIPTSAELLQYATQQTIHTISSQLHAPYLIQSAFGVERQLPRNTTVAVTYTNSHGLHQLRSRDINAPLPGTFTGTAGSGVFPYGDVGPIYQVESSGLYNQNQIITNVNSRMTKNVSLFGFYMLNYARSNTDGIGTFPANQYNEAGEYGPAATDVRNRVFMGGSIATKWDLRFSPFVVLQSGMPFNITTGTDLYGDTLFTGRPGIVTDPSTCDCTPIRYGSLLLNPNPTPGEEILGRNYGRGPAQYTVNLRVAKTFGFGPLREGSAGSGGPGGGGPGGGGGGGGRGPGGMQMGGGMGGMFGGATTSHRYNLTVSVSGRNILNHTNPGQITGNITSPLFGQANSISGGFGAFAENANNRRMELQLRFTF